MTKVGVFTSNSLVVGDLTIHVFDDKTQALEWMVDTLVESGLVHENGDNWMYDDEEYDSRKKLIEDFQGTFTDSQYFHIFPVILTHQDRRLHKCL